MYHTHIPTVTSRYWGTTHSVSPFHSILKCSVPNRPVRPALGTAGLTQAFSETAGPDDGKRAFQKKKAGPGLGDLQASGF